MKNIEDINKAAIQKITANKKITEFSPGDTIKVIRSGKVRRAKLYYLRDRKGKSARIAEKIKKKIGVDVSVKPEEPKSVSVKPVEEAPKTEELKKEDKKVEAKAEKQTSEKK